MRFSRRGQSLLEVLLGILLFVGGISWVLQATVMSFKLAQQSHNELLAAKGVLEYCLEDLRSRNFSTFTDGTQPCSTPAINLASCPDCDQLQGGTATYSIINEGTGVNASELKRVTITVTWKDPGDRLRSSTLVSFLSNSGLTN